MMSDINSFPLYETSGPQPIISDGLFSVIIFIYVAVTFSYVFYAFCFKADNYEENKSKIKEDVEDEDDPSLSSYSVC